VSLGAWFGQDLPPAALPYFPSRFSPRTPLRAGSRICLGPPPSMSMLAG
jgi:hypothetical protein